jgi:hypothetical protein
MFGNFDTQIKLRTCLSNVSADRNSGRLNLSCFRDKPRHQKLNTKNSRLCFVYFEFFQITSIFDLFKNETGWIALLYLSLKEI